MARLEDVCEILDSKRIPITASEREPGPYPYYGANGIQDHVAGYIFDDELVLLAEDGGNFGSAEKPIAYRVSGKCWVNNHAHVLKPKEGLNVDYLCYSLMHYDVSGLVNGATRQKLTQADMRKMEISVPPLGCQHYITDVLNRIVNLISLRKQQLAKLDELVKARFVEMFGDPVINSKNLDTIRGNNLFELSNGVAVPQERRSKSGIPVYGGNGISWYTDLTLCEHDTIVIGRVGFQSGNVHLAKGPLWVSDNAMYISNFVEKKFDLVFLEMLMELINFTRYQDAGDLKKITQKPFMEMDYLFPKIEDQHKYSFYFSRINEYKLTIQQGLDKLEMLKKALMRKYFRGGESL